jgi:hypothetical protein
MLDYEGPIEFLYHDTKKSVSYLIYIEENKTSTEDGQ